VMTSEQAIAFCIVAVLLWEMWERAHGREG
jgi:hypothetical protein